MMLFSKIFLGVCLLTLYVDAVIYDHLKFLNDVDTVNITLVGFAALAYIACTGLFDFFERHDQ